MHNRIRLAVILTAGLLSSAAFAQSAQEQRLCMDDAFKVCGHTIPDRNRTIACMVQNKSSLSSACQMVMDKYASAGSAPAQTAATTAQPPVAPRMTAAPARMSTAPVRTAVNTGRPGKPLNILMR